MTSRYKTIAWKIIDLYQGPILRMFKLMKYKIQGGYPCEGCSNKVRFKNFEVSGPVGPLGTQLMLVNTGKLYCPRCLHDKIEEYFLRSDDVLLGKCDATGEDGILTIKIVWGSDELSKELGIDLRFGTSWWNGFNISRDAFKELLMETGYVKTSMIYHKTGLIEYSDGLILADKQTVKDYN
jgi:hypothetical protein